MKKVLLIIVSFLLLTTLVSCTAIRDFLMASDEEVAWIWDGSVDTSWYDPDEDTFTITTAAQLAGLAEIVNSGEWGCGKTVILGNDIDLAGIGWTSIGNETHRFCGTLDGNGYSILNLKMSQDAIATLQDDSAFGLFYFGSDSTCSDHLQKGEVKIINVKIS